MSCQNCGRWRPPFKPRASTSTYRENSSTAILGIASELIAREHVQKTISLLERSYQCRLYSDTYIKDVKGDIAYAVGNSNNGDLYVTKLSNELLFSIEVKSSLEYQNVAITESELQHSTAKYLIGITTAGMFVATMEEVRRVARKVETYNSSFYLVSYNNIKKIAMIDMFK